FNVAAVVHRGRPATAEALAAEAAELQCGRGCSPRKTLAQHRSIKSSICFNVAAVVHRGRRGGVMKFYRVQYWLQCGRGCSPRKTDADGDDIADVDVLQCGRGCSPRKTEDRPPAVGGA